VGAKWWAQKCPRRLCFFVSNTKWLFGNFATADFRKIWPRHVNSGWNAQILDINLWKVSIQGSFAPKTSNLEGFKQVPHSEQVTGYGMHCREILFTPCCSTRASEFPVCDQLTFLCDVLLGSYGMSKFPNFWILVNFPHTKLPKRTFRWPAYSPGVTSHNSSDFAMWYSKVQLQTTTTTVPSGTVVFLRLLVGELGPPKFPTFSPVANGYTHTECYYTTRQIWTKDVWKRAIRRTYVLFHQSDQMPSPPTPKTP